MICCTTASYFNIYHQLLPTAGQPKLEAVKHIFSQQVHQKDYMVNPQKQRKTSTLCVNLQPLLLSY